MTRVNVIKPEQLADQHLMAEYKEIIRIPAALAKSLNIRGGVQGALSVIPATYRMGTGHVLFFTDKGAYLAARYERLVAELKRRHYNLNPDFRFDPYGIMVAPFNKSWRPDKAALEANVARLQERLQAKPQFYTFWGQPCSTSLHFQAIRHVVDVVE